MIIDFHTHVFPPRIKNDRGEYVARDPSFAALYSNPKAKIATADELMASMDKEGIDVSVILNFCWNTHQMCVETNDYILESVARYPGRMVGFCNVQLNAGDAAIKEIERCAKSGIKGVGEIRPGRELLKNKSFWKSLVEALVKNRLILLTHASEPVGHEYAGKGNITPDFLYPLIVSSPDLTVVCAHWGGGLPFYALMPEVKKALSHVFFDTAASPFLYKPQVYEIVSRLVGADKILFGTDYPLLAPGRLLNEIRVLDLPRETSDMICGGNARKLLGI